MLDHMILTVSDVECSLAFYEASLKPLSIKFFLLYKGEGDHPDLWGFGDGKRAFFWLKQGKPDPEAIHWGFMLKPMPKSMSSTKQKWLPAQGITFHRAHVWNTSPDTTQQMSSTRK